MNLLKIRDTSILKWLVAIIVVGYPIARSLHYTSFYISVGIASYFFVLVSLRRGFISKSFLRARWVYMFFSAPFVSSIWSIMPYHSTYQSGLLLAFGVIFLISHIFFLRNSIEWFYSTIIIASIVFAFIFSVILIIFGSVRPSGEAKDILGSISNHIPAIIIPLTPYLYVMWRAGKKKIWVLLSSIFLVFIVAFSESRAAYGLLFSYAVLIPFFMSDRFTYTVKRIAAFSVVGVLAAGVLYLFAGPQIIQSVLERFSESQLLQGEFGTTQSTNERAGDFARVIMFLETYNIVTTDPITGIGYYTFKPYMESQYPFGRISHNLLLSIWGEMGIFGFVTFVGMVSTAFRLAGKGQKGARCRGDAERWLFLGASKAALVVLLVHAMVRPQLTNPTLWIVVAACLGVGWANRGHRSMPRTADSVSSTTS